MHLIYRGISYLSSSLELTEIKQSNNKNRDILCQPQKAKLRAIASISVLKYRGIEYIKVLTH